MIFEFFYPLIIPLVPLYVHCIRSEHVGHPYLFGFILLALSLGVFALTVGYEVFHLAYQSAQGHGVLCRLQWSESVGMCVRHQSLLSNLCPQRRAYGDAFVHDWTNACVGGSSVQEANLNAGIILARCARLRAQI